MISIVTERRRRPHSGWEVRNSVHVTRCPGRLAAGHSPLDGMPRGPGRSDALAGEELVQLCVRIGLHAGWVIPGSRRWRGPAVASQRDVRWVPGDAGLSGSRLATALGAAMLDWLCCGRSAGSG